MTIITYCNKNKDITIIEVSTPVLLPCIEEGEEMRDERCETRKAVEKSGRGRYNSNGDPLLVQNQALCDSIE